MLKAHYQFVTLALASVLLSACSQPQPVTIKFSLNYHDNPVTCANFANNTANVSLKDFRLYIHQLELQNSLGEWTPLDLVQNSMWQSDTTALLDFENGSGECELGNVDTNHVVVGELPQGDYKGLRFVVGVPFELNHNNPLTADAPLNESSMHWHWQGGYKFVRAEFNIDQQPRRLHIGSLQCKGEVNAISHCETPNRITVALNDFSLNDSQIDISLDNLIDFETDKNTTKLTCMGGKQQPWCNNALNWIGLTSNHSQTAFSVSSSEI